VIEGNFVAVATIGKDGGPRATIAWVDVPDDEHLLFNSAAHRGWPKNLQRDARLAVTAYDRTDPNRNVTLAGHVVEMIEEGGWEHIQELSQRYTGHAYEGATDRVMIRVEIDTARSYGF
jgi:hypothetical protein